jgi:hypothetical protein
MILLIKMDFFTQLGMKILVPRNQLMKNYVCYSS